MTATEAGELRSYVSLIRSRTTNTIEQWNLMLKAEQALAKATAIIPPPDHNGGWEPPLG